MKSARLNCQSAATDVNCSSLKQFGCSNSAPGTWSREPVQGEILRRQEINIANRSTKFTHLTALVADERAGMIPKFGG